MRPFLVLLLVLAALAALLFGILSLLGEAPASAPGPAGGQAPTQGTAQGQPVLDGGRSENDGRTTPVAKPAAERAPSQPGSASYQYDNTLTGLVLDSQGRPVAGAEVFLSTAYELLFVNEPQDTSQDAVARTNTEGRFAFRNLEPRSRYQLTVRHPSYTLKELKSIPVGETGVFEEPPIHLGEGASLSGRVRDAQGMPIANATMNLDGIQYHGANYDAPDRMTTTSDHEGWYGFANVPPGQRTLTLHASGFGTVTHTGLNFTGDEQVNRDVVLLIGEMIRGHVLQGGQPVAGAAVQALGMASSQQIHRGVAMTDARGEFLLENLSPGEYNLIATAQGYRCEPVTRQKTNTDGVIIDCARDAEMCGQVVDAVTGEPVGAFSCRVRLSNGQGQASSPNSEFVAFADARGEFCLPSAPGGEVLIEAQASGYAPGFSTSFRIGRGQTPPKVTIRLTRGGTISGRLVDNAGKPVGQGRVTTHDVTWSDDVFFEMLGESFPTNITKADVRAGDDGRFVISGLTAEKYQIQVRASGFTRYFQNNIVVTDGSETKLGDVKLARGGTLVGTLFDAGGKALVGGQILLSPTDGANATLYHAKSGGDGRFSITNIAPGRYLLTGSRPAVGEGNPLEQMVDNRGTQKTVTISDESTVTIDLTLSP